MRILAFILTLAALWPVAAQAYIGPGAPIALMGFILGPIAAIVTAVVMVVALPFYVIWKKAKRSKTQGGEDEQTNPDRPDSDL